MADQGIRRIPVRRKDGKVVEGRIEPADYIRPVPHNPNRHPKEEGDDDAGSAGTS